jgi:hypothetical protein
MFLSTWEAKRAKVNVFVASCKNNVFVSRDVLQFVAYRLLYCVEGLQVFCRKNIRELPSFAASKQTCTKERFQGRQGENEDKTFLYARFQNGWDITTFAWIEWIGFGRII